MILPIPEFALVLLVGQSGAGKSTFGRRHFLPSEIVSSDHSRYLVSDDANDQSATASAFALVRFLAAQRLQARKLTVVDATSVQREARRPLLDLAHQYDCPAIAIVLNLPPSDCAARNSLRGDRNFPPHVLRMQQTELRRSLVTLESEGFSAIIHLNGPTEIDSAEIERIPLALDRSYEHGPFDIIGDIHGCFDELSELLHSLGYRIFEEGGEFRAAPPENRKAIFLGDLVDRGPKIASVLRLVMNMVRAGTAMCVPGNHDIKLARKLRGTALTVEDDLASTLAQLAPETDGFRSSVADFFDSLPSHYLLNNGNLVVAHAGMKEELQGRDSKRVAAFALYGETTGERDAFGLPVRLNWATEYRGRAMVVYGHTPVAEPIWLNHTVNIDTGCVFGGRLTALRYPERQFISVPAHHAYRRSAKPFAPTMKGNSF